jgi:hypothetical protein
MDSPQNHIWGPQLWIILHSAAERIGTKTLNKLPSEEMRLWTALLTSLRYSLPCPLCKKHFTDYFNNNPLNTFNREFIRGWIYNLHCQVNSRNGLANTITIDQIPEIYNKPFCFTKHMEIIQSQMMLALRLGLCKREDLQKSIRIFNEMKRFYDFF